jgi:serine/threonine protein kinase
MSEARDHEEHESAIAGHTDAGGVQSPARAAALLGTTRTESSDSFATVVSGAAALAGAEQARSPRRLGDFEILEVLGEGSAGQVYLARQVSLDRMVALKVAENLGDEARTMASLEHDSIVQVFSEDIDLASKRRLLCMQYVPGTTLENLLRELRRIDASEWSGARILEVLDALRSRPALFSPAALRDRDELSRSDFFEAVCWFGGRLAEALAHAHAEGVLHRDIKPANILVNPYGRPLLADFSVALDSKRADAERRRRLGGTLLYMAPEHMDAINPDLPLGPEAVDERSDLYSLGVVLYELTSGHLPFPPLTAAGDYRQALRDMAVPRREPPPPLRSRRPDVPVELERAILRCLDPDPAQRFQSAADLAKTLEGCRLLRRSARTLPQGGPILRAAAARPFLALTVLALLPHLAGSAVNIAYNAVYIVGGFSEAQRGAFLKLVLLYNAVVYPLCVAWAVKLALPVNRSWRCLESPYCRTSDDLAVTRCRVAALGFQGVLLAALGWLPGGVVFPLGVSVLAEPVGGAAFGHFLCSFTLAGLIALTYSFFGIELVALRCLYPRFFSGAEGLRQTAAADLKRVPARVRRFQLLAGVVPLLGAALAAGVGLDSPGPAVSTFRFLVIGLIVLGMVGFWLAVEAAGLIAQTTGALTGARAEA